ncbi:MAG: isoaspartyl peptidase/L-asparaginase [Salinivirgaceae bacterium]|jgi:beta-aspartyl-peptidase (threonine type)|nr:isoaspartyl peptidase/L-asparaginase [Salinivirgaceae bacterium]
MSFFKKLKPYLFVLVIFIIPLFLIPIIKEAKENSSPSNNQIKKTKKPKQDNTYAIAIHGGAGNFTIDDLSEEVQMAYKKALFEALETGKTLLAKGVSAPDVVVAVIEKLENDTLFNAGKGAVLTAEGKAELDASIMTGKDRNAGAVAGVTTIKNPIKAARMVMDSSIHVMLAGEGAELYSKKMGIEQVPNTYFYTEKSIKRLEAVKDKHGTVGCVVLDLDGNIAAGTSTGGMNNKQFGRIGDSPIIGAGTWADNRTCAISCTGWGEYFIRLGVAHEIASAMKYQGISIQTAADHVIHEQLQPMGGYGGVIGLDAEGNVAVSFNTSGMFRAFIDGKGNQQIVLFSNK